MGAGVCMGNLGDAGSLTWPRLALPTLLTNAVTRPPAHALPFNPAAHRVSVCTTKMECGAGQYLDAGTTADAGSCKACLPNTYMDKPQHRELGCIGFGKCGKGQKRVSADGNVAKLANTLGGASDSGIQMECDARVRFSDFVRLATRAPRAGASCVRRGQQNRIPKLAATHKMLNLYLSRRRRKKSSTA